MNLDVLLQEQSYLILASLAPTPAHGYRIIQDVAAVSGGSVRLRTGTLYGALDRLAATGLVEVDREEVVAGRLRRYYRLTADGVHVLSVETRRRQTTTAAAAGRLRSLGIRLDAEAAG